MLCFNYTVGFFWSVAVPNGARPSPGRETAQCVRSYPRTPTRGPGVPVPDGHPEPLFIPRLQSRFADFPWPRSLLTRGCSPRRPVAVIGTVAACVRAALGRRRPCARHLGAGCPPAALRLGLGPSTAPRRLRQSDVWPRRPAARAPHGCRQRRGPQGSQPAPLSTLTRQSPRA